MSTKRKLILDCDTGVDDAMAIAYALLHPEAEVLGIGSVWGNIPTELAARNSLKVAELCGCPDVPVAMGAAGPLIGEADFAPHVHGDDGLGNTNQAPPTGQLAAGTAAEQIVRLVREHPGEVTLVPVGPLTNIALALHLDPGIAALVREVVIMGGAVTAPGNVTAVAEANIWHDPEAAHAVFAADWPVTLVPLDVTMKVVLDEDDRTFLRESGTELGQFFHDITDHYFAFYNSWGFGRRSAMHDALAVGIALDRKWVRREVHTNLDVELQGICRGMTVADMRGHAFNFVPEGQRKNGSIVIDADTSFAQHWRELIVSR